MAAAQRLTSLREAPRAAGTEAVAPTLPAEAPETPPFRQEEGRQARKA